MSGGQRESWRPDPGPRERKRKGVPVCVLEVESRREEKRRRNHKCSGEGVCPATFFIVAEKDDCRRGMRRECLFYLCIYTYDAPRGVLIVLKVASCTQC